jgi:hypothetical protein
MTTLTNFLSQQWELLNVGYVSLFNEVKNKQVMLLSKPTMDTSTYDIIIHHRLKSRLLEIMTSIKELEDDMLKLRDELVDPTVTSSSSTLYEDKIINKTISDMTPFLFLYYNNLKESSEYQRQSSHDEVD